jgi:hypothetical protein
LTGMVTAPKAMAPFQMDRGGTRENYPEGGCAQKPHLYDRRIYARDHPARRTGRGAP